MERTVVEDYLVADGISPHLRGFWYLAEAICLYNPTNKLQILYKAVAEKFDTTAAKVQKGICTAIKQADECWTNSEYIAEAYFRCYRACAARCPDRGRYVWTAKAEVRANDLDIDERKAGAPALYQGNNPVDGQTAKDWLAAGYIEERKGLNHDDKEEAID